MSDSGSDQQTAKRSQRKRRGRWLALVVMLFVVLLTTISFRTMRFNSKQISISNDDLDRLKFDVNEDETAERLAQAVRIRTVSYADPNQFDMPEFQRFHAFLQESFPLVHQSLDRETVGGGSLVYHWPARAENTDNAPILLMSHIDVVPEEKNADVRWTYAPFSGTIADGFVYGRGTLDVKSGVMAILEATELLLARGFTPSRSIYFAFGHDEEVGGRNGNRQIAQQFKERGIHFSYVLDEGGAIVTGVVPNAEFAVAMIGVAEKGFVNIELQVDEHGGHAASPPIQTTIGILSTAIRALEESPRPMKLNASNHQMFDYLGPELPLKSRVALANRWLLGPLVKQDFGKKATGRASMRTTFATTIFEAGTAANVLPSTARAVINARIIPGDTIDGSVEWVRNVINDERVTVRPWDMSAAFPPSQISNADTHAFRYIHRSSRAVFPNAVVVPYLTIQATDSRYYVELADDVYRYIPMRLSSDDLERIHGIDERISIDNYADIIRFYAALMTESAGTNSPASN